MKKKKRKRKLTIWVQQELFEEIKEALKNEGYIDLQEKKNKEEKK